MKKLTILLLALIVILPDLFAQEEAIITNDVSSVYVGGHFRRNRPTTVTNLRNSGFTTVILFNVHVDADGTLMTDGETICKDGEYVFANTQPYYVNDVKNLKKAPTSVQRIEICIGGWGNDSYDHIKTLIENDGVGEETILYRNFKALKEAIPEIDAVNNDQEQCYDLASAKKFHKMMGDLGMTTTIAPYTRKDYWQSLATYLKGRKLLDRILIQCYDGGAGNNPSDWQLVSDVPVHAGRMYYQDTWDIPYHIEKFQEWYDNNNVKGGFVWVYNDESWNLHAWATGMNRVYKSRVCPDDRIAARIYSEKNYGGYCIALPTGTYKLAEMALWGITKQDIASVKVEEGYKITIYTNSGCSGKGSTYDADTSDLGSYADKNYSLKVEALDTGIATLEGTPTPSAVYNLQGQYLGTTTTNLPQGIYIINNAKASKKVTIQ